MLVAGCAIPVIAALPEIVNLVKFAGFEAFNPEGKGGNVGFGNLRQPLNPLEALGVWPSSEFRIAPRNSSTPEIAFYLGGLLALAAFAWGLGPRGSPARGRAARGPDRRARSATWPRSRSAPPTRRPRRSRSRRRS